MNADSSDIVKHEAPPIDRMRDILSKARNVLVITHIDPDGDALGTQLAIGQYLRDIGKQTYLMRESEIPRKYLFLSGVGDIIHIKMAPDDLRIDTAVVLECPNLKRMGTVQRLLTDDVTIINIDHHLDGERLGHVNWIDTAASSVGEMVFEFLQEVGYELSAEVATQLYTAILTDTGRFRYSSTTPRTMIVSSELMASGADPRVICNEVYYNMQPSTMLLTGKVLNSLEYHGNGRICLLQLTRRMFDEAGATEYESEGMVDFTLFTAGVTTGALLKEIDDDTTKVSFRSSDGINVSEIASRFGGGGHRNAAGCVLPMDMKRARKEIIRLLLEANGSPG